MATIGALMDRIFGEWLYQIGDRPVQAEIVNPLTDVDSTMTLADHLTPEEQSLLMANAICELGSELVRVVDLDPETRVATIRRGQMGTTASAHVAGSLCLIEPKYTRQKVLAALGDEIVGLYPELWRLITTDTVLDSVVELPEEAEGFVSARNLYGDGYEGNFLIGYDQMDTGRAVSFYDEAVGQVGWITYATGFTRPSSESQELGTLGIEDGWQKLLIVSTAGMLIRGREFDLASLEFLTEAIESSALRIGSPSDVATNLLRYRQLLITIARQALIARQGTTVYQARVI